MVETERKLLEKLTPDVVEYIAKLTSISDISEFKKTLEKQLLDHEISLYRVREELESIAGKIREFMIRKTHYQHQTLTEIIEKFEKLAYESYTSPEQQKQREADLDEIFKKFVISVSHVKNMIDSLPNEIQEKENLVGIFRDRIEVVSSIRNQFDYRHEDKAVEEGYNKLYREVFGEEYKIDSSEKNRVVAIRTDSEEIGWIEIFTPNNPEKEPYDLDVYVQPEYRGIGLSDKLADAFRKKAIELGAKKFESVIESENPEAIEKFFKRQQERGLIENLEFEPEPAVEGGKVRFNIKEESEHRHNLGNMFSSVDKSQLILELIEKYPAITDEEISQKENLPLNEVNSILQKLREQGKIRQVVKTADDADEKQKNLNFKKREVRWGNPQKQILNDPKVKEGKEALFYKAPGNDLRRPLQVTGSKFLLMPGSWVMPLSRIKPNENTALHNHPYHSPHNYKGKNLPKVFGAAPSAGDIHAMFNYIRKNPKFSSYVIVVTGPNNSELGRVVFYASKKFREKYTPMALRWLSWKRTIQAIAMENIQIFKTLIFAIRTKDINSNIEKVIGLVNDLAIEETNFLKNLEKDGIKIRFVPSKGHKFDPKIFDFVKEQESKNEKTSSNSNTFSSSENKKLKLDIARIYRNANPNFVPSDKEIKWVEENLPSKVEKVNYRKIASNARVLIFNEYHSDISPKRELAENMKLFRKMGFTDIAMEIFGKDDQELLNLYFKESDSEKAKKYEVQLYELLSNWLKELDPDWLMENPSLADEYLAVIKVAKENGIRIRAIDVSKQNYGYVDRDKFMANAIAKILQEGNDRRVLVLVGMAHGNIEGYYSYWVYKFNSENYIFTLKSTPMIKILLTNYRDIVKSVISVDVLEKAEKILSSNVYVPSYKYRYLLYQAILEAKLQNERFMLDASELNSMQWVVYSPKEIYSPNSFSAIENSQKNLAEQYGYTKEEIETMKRVVEDMEAGRIQDIPPTREQFKAALRGELPKYYLERFRWFKEASDEVLEEKITPGTKNRYKAKGATIFGIMGALQEAVSRKVIKDPNLIKDIEKFTNYEWNFGKPLPIGHPDRALGFLTYRTTHEEIAYINSILDKVIAYLESNQNYKDTAVKIPPMTGNNPGVNQFGAGNRKDSGKKFQEKQYKAIKYLKETYPKETHFRKSKDISERISLRREVILEILAEHPEGMYLKDIINELKERGIDFSSGRERHITKEIELERSLIYRDIEVLEQEGKVRRAEEKLKIPERYRDYKTGEGRERIVSRRVYKIFPADIGKQNEKNAKNSFSVNPKYRNTAGVEKTEISLPHKITEKYKRILNLKLNDLSLTHEKIGEILKQEGYKVGINRQAINYNIHSILALPNEILEFLAKEATDKKWTAKEVRKILNTRGYEEEVIKKRIEGYKLILKLMLNSVDITFEEILDVLREEGYSKGKTRYAVRRQIDTLLKMPDNKLKALAEEATGRKWAASDVRERLGPIRRKYIQPLIFKIKLEEPEKTQHEISKILMEKYKIGRSQVWVSSVIRNFRKLSDNILTSLAKETTGKKWKAAKVRERLKMRGKRKREYHNSFSSSEKPRDNPTNKNSLNPNALQKEKEHSELRKNYNPRVPPPRSLRDNKFAGNNAMPSSFSEESITFGKLRKAVKLINSIMSTKGEISPKEILELSKEVNLPKGAFFEVVRRKDTAWVVHLSYKEALQKIKEKGILSDIRTRLYPTLHFSLKIDEFFDSLRPLHIIEKGISRLKAVYAFPSNKAAEKSGLYELRDRILLVRVNANEAHVFEMSYVTRAYILYSTGIERDKLVTTYARKYWNSGIPLNVFKENYEYDSKKNKWVRKKTAPNELLEEYELPEVLYGRTIPPEDIKIFDKNTHRYVKMTSAEIGLTKFKNFLRRIFDLQLFAEENFADKPANYEIDKITSKHLIWSMEDLRALRDGYTVSGFTAEPVDIRAEASRILSVEEKRDNVIHVGVYTLERFEDIVTRGLDPMKTHRKEIWGFKNKFIMAIYESLNPWRYLSIISKDKRFGIVTLVVIPKEKFTVEKVSLTGVATTKFIPNKEISVWVLNTYERRFEKFIIPKKKATEGRNPLAKEHSPEIEEGEEKTSSNQFAHSTKKERNENLDSITQFKKQIEKLKDMLKSKSKREIIVIGRYNSKLRRGEQRKYFEAYLNVPKNLVSILIKTNKQKNLLAPHKIKILNAGTARLVFRIYGKKGINKLLITLRELEKSSLFSDKSAKNSFSSDGALSYTEEQILKILLDEGLNPEFAKRIAEATILWKQKRSVKKVSEIMHEPWYIINNYLNYMKKEHPEILRATIKRKNKNRNRPRVRVSSSYNELDLIYKKTVDEIKRENLSLEELKRLLEELNEKIANEKDLNERNKLIMQKNAVRYFIDEEYRKGIISVAIFSKTREEKQPRLRIASKKYDNRFSSVDSKKQNERNVRDEKTKIADGLSKLITHLEEKYLYLKKTSSATARIVIAPHGKSFRGTSSIHERRGAMKEEKSGNKFGAISKNFENGGTEDSKIEKQEKELQEVYKRTKERIARLHFVRLRDMLSRIEELIKVERDNREKEKLELMREVVIERIEQLHGKVHTKLEKIRKEYSGRKLSRNQLDRIYGETINVLKNKNPSKDELLRLLEELNDMLERVKDESEKRALIMQRNAVNEIIRELDKKEELKKLSNRFSSYPENSNSVFELRRHIVQTVLENPGISNDKIFEELEKRGVHISINDLHIQISELKNRGALELDDNGNIFVKKTKKVLERWQIELQLIDQGFNNNQISKTLGVTKSTVSSDLKTMGLSKTERIVKGIEDRRKVVLSLAKKGLTIEEISKKVGRSITIVSRDLRAAGFSKKAEVAKKVEQRRAKVSKLIGKLSQGKIAKMLGVSQPTISSDVLEIKRKLLSTADMKEKIKELLERDKNLGAKKIRDLLREKGVKISVPTVGRILKKVREEHPDLKRTKARSIDEEKILKRQMKVKGLYEQGYSQRYISEMLGISQTRVSADLKRLREKGIKIERKVEKEIKRKKLSLEEAITEVITNAPGIEEIEIFPMLREKKIKTDEIWGKIFRLLKELEERGLIRRVEKTENAHKKIFLYPSGVDVNTGSIGIKREGSQKKTEKEVESLRANAEKIVYEAIKKEPYLVINKISEILEEKGIYLSLEELREIYSDVRYKVLTEEQTNDPGDEKVFLLSNNGNHFSSDDKSQILHKTGKEILSRRDLISYVEKGAREAVWKLNHVLGIETFTSHVGRDFAYIGIDLRKLSEENEKILKLLKKEGIVKLRKVGPKGETIKVVVNGILYKWSAAYIIVKVNGKTTDEIEKEFLRIVSKFSMQQNMGEGRGRTLFELMEFYGYSFIHGKDRLNIEHFKKLGWIYDKKKGLFYKNQVYYERAKKYDRTAEKPKRKFDLQLHAKRIDAEETMRRRQRVLELRLDENLPITERTVSAIAKVLKNEGFEASPQLIYGDIKVIERENPELKPIFDEISKEIKKLTGGRKDARIQLKIEELKKAIVEIVAKNPGVSDVELFPKLREKLVRSFATDSGWGLVFEKIHELERKGIIKIKIERGVNGKLTSRLYWTGKKFSKDITRKRHNSEKKNSKNPKQKYFLDELLYSMLKENPSLRLNEILIKLGEIKVYPKIEELREAYSNAKYRTLTEEGIKSRISNLGPGTFASLTEEEFSGKFAMRKRISKRTKDEAEKEIFNMLSKNPELGRRIIKLKLEEKGIVVSSGTVSNLLRKIRAENKELALKAPKPRELSIPPEKLEKEIISIVQNNPKIGARNIRRMLERKGIKISEITASRYLSKIRAKNPELAKNAPKSRKLSISPKKLEVELFNILKKNSKTGTKEIKEILQRKGIEISERTINKYLAILRKKHPEFLTKEQRTKLGLEATLEILSENPNIGRITLWKELRRRGIYVSEPTANIYLKKVSSSQLNFLTKRQLIRKGIPSKNAKRMVNVHTLWKQGYTYAEISAKLDIAPSSVTDILHKIKNLFPELMKERQIRIKERHVPENYENRLDRLYKEISDKAKKLSKKKLEKWLRELNEKIANEKNLKKRNELIIQRNAVRHWLEKKSSIVNKFGSAEKVLTKQEIKLREHAERMNEVYDAVVKNGLYGDEIAKKTGLSKGSITKISNELEEISQSFKDALEKAIKNKISYGINKFGSTEERKINIDENSRFYFIYQDSILEAYKLLEKGDVYSYFLKWFLLLEDYGNNLLVKQEKSKDAYISEAKKHLYGAISRGIISDKKLTQNIENLFKKLAKKSKGKITLAEIKELNKILNAVIESIKKEYPEKFGSKEYGMNLFASRSMDNSNILFSDFLFNGYEELNSVRRFANQIPYIRGIYKRLSEIKGDMEKYGDNNDKYLYRGMVLRPETIFEILENGMDPAKSASRKLSLTKYLTDAMFWAFFPFEVPFNDIEHFYVTVSVIDKTKVKIHEEFLSGEVRTRDRIPYDNSNPKNALKIYAFNKVTQRFELLLPREDTVDNTEKNPVITNVPEGSVEIIEKKGDSTEISNSREVNKFSKHGLPMVVGVIHAIPIQKEGENYREDRKFLDYAIEQIDKAVRKGAKVVAVEVSPEILEYFNELKKIIDSNFKEKYKPPENLPKTLRDYLNAAQEIVSSLQIVGIPKEEIKKIILREGLTFSHRFWMSAINYAEGKGLRVVPLIRFDLTERFTNTINEIIKTEEGDKRMSRILAIEGNLIIAEGEHFMIEKIEELIKTGISPDLYLVGDFHTEEIVKKLENLGIKAVRVDVPIRLLYRMYKLLKGKKANPMGNFLQSITGIYRMINEENKLKLMFGAYRKAYPLIRKRKIEELVTVLEIIKSNKENFRGNKFSSSEESSMDKEKRFLLVIQKDDIMKDYLREINKLDGKIIDLFKSQGITDFSSLSRYDDKNDRDILVIIRDLYTQIEDEVRISDLPISNAYNTEVSSIDIISFKKAAIRLSNLDRLRKKVNEFLEKIEEEETDTNKKFYATELLKLISEELEYREKYLSTLVERLKLQWFPNIDIKELLKRYQGLVKGIVHRLKLGDRTITKEKYNSWNRKRRIRNAWKEQIKKERRVPFEISLKELGERLAFDVHKEIEAIRDKDRKEFPRATPRLISIIQIGVGKGRSLNELSEISDEYVEILGIGARRSEEWKTKTVERSYMHHPRRSWEEPYEVKYAVPLLNWKVGSIRKLLRKVPHNYYDFVLADFSDYPASLINEILNTLHVIAKPHAKIVVALSENALKAIKVDSEKIRLIRQISSGGGIIALHFENSNRADYRNFAARIYKGVRNNFGRKHGQIYEYTATPLNEVQERLGVNLLEKLNSLIENAEKAGREKPKVLDVGSGNGVAIIQLAEKSNYRAEYYALDIKRWPGWTNTKIHWKIGPMEELSRLYKDIKFDLIYSHFGIYNSIDVEKTIQETYKILNYGGTLVTNLKLGGLTFSEKIAEIKELLGPFAEEAEIEYKQVNGRDIITIKKPYENLKNSFSAIYQNEFKDEQLSTKKLEIKLKHKERQIAELNEKLREISNIRRTKHDTLIPRQKRSLQRSIGKLKEEINEIKLKILEIKTSEVIASHEEVNYNEIIHKSAKFVNFNELHTDISPKREIAMSMALFRELGFTDIAMEIFRKDANTQKLLDVYFAEKNPNKINEYEFEILRKIYEKLDARWLKENPSLAYEYLAVVKAAKENGIRIRAIDVPAGYENLDRDKFMADTIIEILQEDESRRVLGLTGYAHGHEKSYYFYPDFEFGERASSFRISMRTLLNKRGVESVYIDIIENEPKLNIPTNVLGLGELYAPSSYYRYLLYQAVLKAKLQNKRFMINMINFPELNLQWVVFSPREFVERLTFQYVPKIEKLEGTGFNSFSSIHKEDDKERIFETPDGTKYKIEKVTERYITEGKNWLEVEIIARRLYDKEKIIGVVYLFVPSKPNKSGDIFISVERSYRRKGVSSALFKAFIEEARKHNVKRIETMVNKDSLSFFRRMEREGLLKNLDGPYGNRYVEFDIPYEEINSFENSEDPYLRKVPERFGIENSEKMKKWEKRRVSRFYTRESKGKKPIAEALKIAPKEEREKAYSEGKMIFYDGNRKIEVPLRKEMPLQGVYKIGNEIVIFRKGISLLVLYHFVDGREKYIGSFYTTEDLPHMEIDKEFRGHALGLKGASKAERHIRAQKEGKHRFNLIRGVTDIFELLYKKLGYLVAEPTDIFSLYSPVWKKGKYVPEDNLDKFHRIEAIDPETGKTRIFTFKVSGERKSYNENSMGAIIMDGKEETEWQKHYSEAYELRKQGDIQGYYLKLFEFFRYDSIDSLLEQKIDANDPNYYSYKATGVFIFRIKLILDYAIREKVITNDVMLRDINNFKNYPWNAMQKLPEGHPDIALGFSTYRTTTEEIAYINSFLDKLIAYLKGDPNYNEIVVKIPNLRLDRKGRIELSPGGEQIYETETFDGERYTINIGNWVERHLALSAKLPSSYQRMDSLEITAVEIRDGNERRIEKTNIDIPHKRIINQNEESNSLAYTAISKQTIWEGKIAEELSRISLGNILSRGVTYIVVETNRKDLALLEKFLKERENEGLIEIHSSRLGGENAFVQFAIKKNLADSAENSRNSFSAGGDEEETSKERTKRLREIAKYYYQSLLKTHTVVPIGSVFHGGRARDNLAIFEYPGSTKKESDIDIITISYEDAKTERVDITDATGVEITIIKFPFSEFYKIFSPKVGYITELPLAINPIFIQGKNSDLVKKILEEANIQNTKIALERYLYEKNSREVRPIDLTDIIMRKLMPLSFRIISPESYSRVNFIRQISNNVENALENGNLAKRVGNKPEKFTSLSKFIINENIKPKPHRFQQLKSDYNLFFGRGWFGDGRALKIIRIAFKLNKKFYWIKIPFEISKKFAIYGIKIIKSKFTKFKKEFKNRIKTKKAQQINRGLEISQESVEIDYHPRKNSLTLYFNVENVGESTIKKFSTEISFSGTKYSTIIEIENINLKRGQFAFINIEIEDEFLIKRFRGRDFISGSIKIVCFEDKYGKVEDANEQSFTRFPESI
ncbi:MAG: GNAT family N-acetyltransferase [Candidatus Altiarchaeota archaeon]